MGVLQRFERRLEHLVQGAFARTFGGWVEPVEIAAALTREAEDRKAIIAAGRVLVPNDYVVELGQGDFERLGEYDEALRTELSAMVEEAAQEQGWSFVGTVGVRFDLEPTMDTGAFRVRSAVVARQDERPASERSRGPRLESGHESWPLTASTVVGRGTEAQVQLADSGVSRRHLELTTHGSTVIARDLGSTNGTRLNGNPLSEAVLQDGDVLVVGTTSLTYRSGA
jgi:hypothetical protein